MAAKKSKKRAKKTPAKKKAELHTAQRVTGLSATALKAIDDKCVKAGKRPLTFLANRLDSERKNVPVLEKAVKRLAGK